ncbi:MAG: glycosyltransferase family 4 protein [Candidatus Acidiferrum sp.]
MTTQSNSASIEPSAVANGDSSATFPGLSVLHVILCLDPGGLERVVIDLTREAAGVGQTASILCIEKPGVLAPQAQSVTKLYCSAKGPGLSWAVVDRIRSLLKELRPDVVHTHQISALFYLAPISRKLTPILVHTEHNNQFRRYQTFREKFTYFSMLAAAGPRVDRMFAVSEDARQSILNSHVIPRRKLFTVPNGINFDRFRLREPDLTLRKSLGIPDDSFVFGNIGRLTEMKRPDILIDAFAKLSAEFPASHLLLVGDGPLMVELRNQAATLKIADRVHFTGFQPKPEQYLGMLDVFVLTSRMEGMPLAVLEASASGIPVIASKVGGLEEMSDGGRSILLYEFGDMDALLSGLRRLASQSDYRQRLAQAGREHVLTAYAAKRMARDYAHHYTQIKQIQAR